MRTDSGSFYQYIDKSSKRKHWTFTPSEISRFNIKIDQEITELLIKAHHFLGIVEGMVECIPYVERFLRMMACHDACKSCQIDRIAVSYDAVLTGMGNSMEVQSAQNCYASFLSLPGEFFSIDWLCDLHYSVMYGILSDGAGKIRDKVFLMHPQYTSNMEEYNPPIPELVLGLLQDLQCFVLNNKNVDVFIKAALLYYQFETIHPFYSGNGRTGRLLPIAMLMKQGGLSKGCLFISEYLFQNDDECMNLFRNVQYFGDYMEWIKFFLRCIISSSDRTVKQLDAAVKERSRTEEKLRQCPKFYAELAEIYDFIEASPVFLIKDIAHKFDISYNTAASRVAKLTEMKIVKLEKEQSRNRIFKAQRYIEVFADHY